MQNKKLENARIQNKKLENVGDIIERLKIITKSRNDAELARLLGVGSSRIPTWKKRGVIDMLLIAQKCEGINTGWLLTGEGEMMIGKRPLNAAETPGEQPENVIDRLKRSVVEDERGVYRQGGPYKTPAIGPLMTPEKIKEGDVLFIDPTEQPVEGDFIMVKTDSGPKIQKYRPEDPQEAFVGVVLKVVRERIILQQ
jgi:hypothetical protein